MCIAQSPECRQGHTGGLVNFRLGYRGLAFEEIEVAALIGLADMG
jgi:hypothetical protein